MKSLLRTWEYPFLRNGDLCKTCFGPPSMLGSGSTCAVQAEEAAHGAFVLQISPFSKSGSFAVSLQLEGRAKISFADLSAARLYNNLSLLGV